VAAYEELSFTLAAQRENATQPGVSQHVGYLEESLGVQLFIRGDGAVRATPAGTAYYSACIELLNAQERTLSAVKPFKSSLVGEITAGMTPVMTRAVLAPSYTRFARVMPNVNVRVIDSYFGDLTDGVRKGEMNFAIVPSAVGSKGVRTSLFARMPELLVSGKSSSLVHLQPVRLKDLIPLDLAIPGPNNARRRMIDNYLTANGVAVKRLLEFETMFGTLDLVARGDWSGILPLMMMEPDIDSGNYKINPIIDPPLMLELFLLEPARKIMDEPALAFLDCLRAELERINCIAAQLMAGKALKKATPKPKSKSAR